MKENNVDSVQAAESRPSSLSSDEGRTLRMFHADNRCRKCGSKATSYYREANDRKVGDFFARRYPYDVIDRTCERCFYSWQELPLDHARNAEPATTLETVSTKSTN